jgi:hypothetical protein
MPENIVFWTNENAGLPKNAEGHIESPRYVPENSPYLEQWRIWLQSHPKSDWPEWLKRDLAEMKVKGIIYLTPTAESAGYE